jgi:hypothetical protein
LSGDPGVRMSSSENKYDPPLLSQVYNTCQEVSKAVPVGEFPNVLIEIEHLISSHPQDEFITH